MHYLMSTLLLLSSLVSNSQTVISSNITANTTWVAADSPYLISSFITVQSGVTLNIEPGSIIKMNIDGGLLINGTLRAIGTEDSLIKFTSDQFIPYEGDWNSINFNSTSTPYDDLSGVGCILSYCVIEYGGYSGTPFFPNGHVVQIYDASPKIEFCTFYKNNSAIFIEQLSQKMTVENCRFLENTGVNGMTPSAFYLFETGLDSLVFHCNLFMKNGFGAPNPFNLTGNVRVSNNIFVQNINSGAAVFWAPKNSMTTKNQFIKNVAYCGSTILLYGDFQNNLVTQNKNEGCFRTITCKDTNSNINHNNIYDNYSLTAGHHYELRNENQRHYYLSPHVDAVNNYWGTTTPAEIDSLVFDYFDDTTMCHLSISPFLSSLDTTAPISPVSNFTIIDIGGGQLELSWAPNLEADLAGYKVYWGNPTGYSYDNSIDVGNVTTYILTGVSSSEEIAVTAYDTQAHGTSDQCNCHESWFATTTEVQSLSEDIEKNTSSPSFYIYPNPASTNIKIEIQNNESGNLEIYSASGQIVLETSFSSNTVVVDIGSLRPGYYICKIGDSTLPLVILR